MVVSLALIITPMSVVNNIGIEVVFLTSGVVVGVISVVQAVAAYKLSSGSNTARIIITILVLLSALFGIGSIFHSFGGFLWIIVDGIVIYCLWFNDEAKATFNTG
jgi:hypothetical protein